MDERDEGVERDERVDFMPHAEVWRTAPSVEAEPNSRRITHIHACHSRNEGIFPFDFETTEDDLAAFREIVEHCPVDAVS